MQDAAAHSCGPGSGTFGSVSTVRVKKSERRKHPLERPGTVFALKALKKKAQREMEMVRPIVATPAIARLTRVLERMAGRT